MKKIVTAVFFAIILSANLNAQNTVKGIVINSDSENPLPGVLVYVKKNLARQITTIDGVFNLQTLPKGKHIITFKAEGYETQNFPITLSGKIINLGTIAMYATAQIEIQDLSTITISDDELDGDTFTADNISGLLQSSKDAYLKAAAYEFSSSFYRVRGLGSENGKVLINGIEMNKHYNGRPQWSNWGGLNNLMRNQEFNNGLSASSYTFGGALGATNINVRASAARPGLNVSYASSNRSYVHRLMVSYASGISKNGWAYTVAASRRAGQEGFVEGASYNSNSFFAAVEKKINDKNNLNFTAIYARNKRGKSASLTQEIYDLRGATYNSYWGYQDKKIRNSRLKTIEEPILMLNHYWDISEKTSLNTNVAYQFGKVGNSRLDYNGSKVDGTAVDGNGDPFIVGLGGANPDPSYYQKLPSYGLREDYTNVYEMEQEFITNGQIKWDALYVANSSTGGNAAYMLYEDRNDDDQFTFNTILNTEINEHITLNGVLKYTHLKSENFGNVLDLLGGNAYLDIDTFADNYTEKQNDLLNPLQLASVGDKIKYNFKLEATVLSGFAQAQFTYHKADFFVATRIAKTTYQREGLFKNGGFPTNSLGKSDKIEFSNFNVKGGLTYKISGRHILSFNTGYLSKAPTLRNTFENSRENNEVVRNLTSEKMLTADASYILRTPIIQARLTGFYSKIEDATEISFFFADGLGGDNTAFLQEILSDIDKKNFGAEFGIEAQITPTIKLKGAANYGQYTYDNNPNIYITTENNNNATKAGFINGRKELGKTNLKNYKLSAGPQRVFSVGFEYRDPDYWFFGATTNFFSNVYIDTAPLTRSSNFTDDGGLPFNDYDPEIARQLLQQEKFNRYTVVNAIGGKTWRIVNKQYIGFFMSIGNIFDTQYKTGGYEQGRNANYRQLRDDKALDKPVFGNKYWFGRGTTYFLNVSYRF